MNDVCVPAELVEALDKARQFQVRMANLSGREQGNLLELFIAAKALVDAVERPSEDETVAPVIHACPSIRSGLMPCCGRTPFEVQGADSITTDPSKVTCEAVMPSGCDCGNCDTTAPAAPPSEPLCRCGHPKGEHAALKGSCGRLNYGSGCEVHICSCNAFAPRPSISDEAEAAWDEWYLENDQPWHHGTKPSFLAGFRAARQEEA